MSHSAVAPIPSSVALPTISPGELAPWAFFFGLIAVLVLFFKQNATAAISLGAVMLLLYIPLSYYTDQALYKRRLKQKGQTPPAKTKTPKES